MIILFIEPGGRKSRDMVVALALIANEGINAAASELSHQTQK